jgi:hypothetical protein
MEKGYIFMDHGSIKDRLSIGIEGHFPGEAW